MLTHTQNEPQIADSRPEQPSPPSGQRIYPYTPVEFVNTIAHYYRGEMSRMAGWRDRIDRTTNWAIAAVAAMLSVSLSSPNAHHSVLLFAMLLVYLLLHIESRRYRFFDVYRTRVRQLERFYYAQIFNPQPQTDVEEWMKFLSNGLRQPTFSISFRQAMARRLRRNYIWVFLILLLAWLLKTSSQMLQFRGFPSEFIHTTGQIAHNARIGGLSGWIVVAGLTAFYGWLFYLLYKHQDIKGELSYGEVHV